jgi:hypothetical protein
MVESGAGAPAEWFCEQQPERRFAVGFAGSLPLAGRSIGDVFYVGPCSLRSYVRHARPLARIRGGTTKAFTASRPNSGMRGFFYWVF